MTPPDAFAPARLGPIQLRNRIVKAATYEGLSRKGMVTQELIDFHCAPAAGGVGMTTVAYCAVAKDGRTDRNQITWREESLPGLQALTEAVHAEGAAISAQLGHGGPVAEARSNRSPALAPSRRLNVTAFNVSQKATEADIERITAAHGDAARMAERAGFDAVEVHLGHNYFASAFLSPRLNRRTDQFGGSLENRAKVARDVARNVYDAVGGRLGVIVKMNMQDGVAGGFDLPESLQVAQWIEADGTADALELTAGSSLSNPMYLFRGDAPLREFAAVMPQPIRLGVGMFGGHLLKTYPYTDAYLLDLARQFRAELELPLVLLGGINELETIESALSEGFDFVAMARALLRDPDLPNKLADGRSTAGLCVHCNKCLPTIYSGTRCVLVN